jgi:DnaK suppressor protein
MTRSSDSSTFLPGPLSVEQRSVLRAALETRLRTLRAEIGAATEPRTPGEPPSLPSAYGEADMAVADLQLDLDFASLERDAKELADVADALQRLDTTAFGVCPDCGQPIPWARLRAVPEVRRCAGCETRLERTATPAIATRI